MYAPARLLERAREAAHAGRLERALRFHLEFHRRATARDPSFSGAWLRDNLGRWAELARRHEPALRALRRLRERAARLMERGRGSRIWFQAVAFIDRTLGEPSRTAELFRRLHRRRPATAKDCYRLAEPSLIEAGQLALCVEYLGDPLLRFREEMRFNRSFLEASRDDLHRLVAILSELGRRGQARRLKRRLVAFAEVLAQPDLRT